MHHESLYCCFHTQTCCHVSSCLFPVKSQLGMDIKKMYPIACGGTVMKVGKHLTFLLHWAENCHTNLLFLMADFYHHLHHVLEHLSVRFFSIFILCYLI